ncbi:hypothetical protein ACH5RR_030111 [Cinchona calisaya]|uniref:Elongator complex protein 2 n=1 Tax=Cinchona calisaya TaxID=153742 RepID=A0ABD2YTM0_9GENT
MERHYLLSGDADGAIILWEYCIVNKQTMVVLSLAELPRKSGYLALAMGGLDNKIIFFVFVLACQLKGHTDWIRSLDFSLPIHENGETCILLVSSSQDKGIRIWNIALCDSLDNNMKEEISLASFIKGPVFVADLSPYQVSMESLLIGHEDWVYSVEWQPLPS